MIDDIQKRTSDRMKKSIEALKHEFSKIRTGRAHPSLLEHVSVSYYGNECLFPRPPTSPWKMPGPLPLRRGKEA